MRVAVIYISVLLIMACYKKDCAKDSGPPDINRPCDTIRTTDKYSKGHQGDGWFEGIYNCFMIEGSAQARFDVDSTGNELAAITLSLYNQFGGAKILLFTGGNPFVEDTSYLQSIIKDNIFALTIFDHIEEIEDRYSLDTTFVNSVFFESMSRVDTNLVTGKLTLHLKVDEPKVTSSNPDEMHFIDCVFECRFWN